MIRPLIPIFLLALTVGGVRGQDAPQPTPDAQSAPLDPLVEASAYRDKSVWSYHDGKNPVPWRLFKPKDFGATKVEFSGEGVTSVGKVPPPGVHPRIFFSPEDLPAMRKRIKEDRGAREAWLNLLAWSNALRLTYDEGADYAQPDRANGSFHVRGRFADLHRIGGYNPNREDYYSILAEGGRPETYEKTPPAEFFKPAAAEAFRCLIEEDAGGARRLAAATVTAVKLEQERRANNPKPVGEGQPPKVSTSRSSACALGYVYDFIYNWMTPEQQNLIREELVALSAWADNYGTFNNAEASRSNWATFSYWVFDLMAIEGEPGFNDLKFLGLYRGWRNFFTYGFFDSGAAYEAEGKLLFGLDAAVAFDRVAHKYGLEPLTHHPLPRRYYSDFSALAMLPTRDSFAVFDILGGMGGGFTTPQDLVIAKYLYPNDKTIDFAYRAMVGDDYQKLPHSLHFHWHQALTSAIFATAYNPEISPESLGMPLTFFCGQRGLMMTRSSWDKDATMLTMQVRGASGGHPYRDRNGIMMSGKGRTWVTIPGKDVGGWAMNTVLIDGGEQNASTPARVVDFSDQNDATFLTGDAKYSWDWVWRTAEKNMQGGPARAKDVKADNVAIGAGWSLVDQTFNDFAWTKNENPVFNRPLKFQASWIGMDGNLTPVIRQVNTPVLRSFRTAGLVRGPHPYVLVVDDIERDGLPARYDWNLTLPGDVVEVKRTPGEGSEGDIVLAGKDDMDPDGALRPNSPALLIRPLAVNGERMNWLLGPREKQNILSLSTRATSPDFKVLLYAFRQGEPLPEVSRHSSGQKFTIRFPGQEDIVETSPGTAGKTNVTITRAGKSLVAMTRDVPPLGDPASEELTARLKSLPARAAEVRAGGFDPAKLPGFVAGWNFDKAEDGFCQPIPGSDAMAGAAALGSATVVEGVGGTKAIRTTNDAINIPMGFSGLLNRNFTIDFWVRTKSGPHMGNLLNMNGQYGLALTIRQGSVRVSAARNWDVTAMATSMLSAWTHFAVTSDGEKIEIFRNGVRVVTAEVDGSKINLGNEIVLGGMNGNGTADSEFGAIRFYDTVLPPEDIERLYVARNGGK